MLTRESSVINYSSLQEKFDLASKITVIGMGFIFPISITGFAIFLVATFIFSLLAGNYLEKLNSLLKNKVFVMAMLLFALLMLSAFYSTGTTADVKTVLSKYSKLLYLIFLMPLFIDDRWKKKGIDAFLAAMLLTLAISFMKMFGWVHIGKGGLGTIFTNHINTGFLMAFAAFILAHRCFDQHQKFRWLYAILLLLVIYHIFFMNEGRTGYLVFAALFIVFLWQKIAWKGLLISAAILPILLTGAFLFSTNFKARIEIISHDLSRYHQHQLDANSIGLRLQFNKNSFALIKQHPIIGTGVGSFRQEYSNHFPPDPGFANMNNPQNEYLMFLVQIGIVGLIALLALFFTQWRASFSMPLQFKYLAQGMIIAFMVGCACDTFIFLAIPGYFFVYFTALFFAKNNVGVNR